MRETAVALLAGGMGTRLGVLAQKRAKPAVPFAGIYRIIDFALSNVANSGLDNVGVLTQYRPFSLMDHLSDGWPWDLHRRRGGLKVLPPHTGAGEEDWYKGTADAMWQNRDWIDRIGGERVLVLSGDHIYAQDYRQLIDFHRERGAELTIAVMRVPAEEVQRFGVLEADGDGRVTRFWEKPKGFVPSTLGSMGIYVFERSVLIDELASVCGRGHHYDFGADVIPGMIGRRRVFAYLFHGYWRDVGTLQSYWDANMDLLDPGAGLDPAGWRIRTNLFERNLADRAPARFAPAASVSDVALSPGCLIEGTAVRSVLSPGVRVERGARVRGCVLLHDARVGAGALLERVIADKDVVVEPGAVVGAPGDAPLSVLGKGAVIPARCRIGAGAVVAAGARPEHFPDEVPAGGVVEAK